MDQHSNQAPPHPRALLDGLMKNIELEMEVARTKNEAEKKNSYNKEKTPEIAVEVVETEVTQKSYTGQKEEEEFTLVDLVEVEEEEEIDKKRFYNILDKLNSTFSAIEVGDKSEELTKYNKALKKLTERVTMIEIPEEHRRSIREVVEMRNITFVKAI